VHLHPRQAQVVAVMELLVWDLAALEGANEGVVVRGDRCR
jgi:hypothetical protein